MAIARMNDPDWVHCLQRAKLSQKYPFIAIHVLAPLRDANGIAPVVLQTLDDFMRAPAPTEACFELSLRHLSRLEVPWPAEECITVSTLLANRAAEALKLPGRFVPTAEGAVLDMCAQAPPWSSRSHQAMDTSTPTLPGDAALPAELPRASGTLALHAEWAALHTDLPEWPASPGNAALHTELPAQWPGNEALRTALPASPPGIEALHAELPAQSPANAALCTALPASPGNAHAESPASPGNAAARAELPAQRGNTVWRGDLPVETLARTQNAELRADSPTPRGNAAHTESTASPRSTENCVASSMSRKARKRAAFKARRRHKVPRRG